MLRKACNKTVSQTRRRQAFPQLCTLTPVLSLSLSRQMSSLSYYDLRQRGHGFACICLLSGWLVCQHDFTETAQWISTTFGWRMDLSPE